MTQKQCLFRVALVLAILMLSSGALAYPILPGTLVQFGLTATRQDLNDEEVRPSTFHSTLQSVRITNRDILQFIADANSINIPQGTQLWVDQSGKYLVAIDRHGKILGSIAFEITVPSSLVASRVANPLHASGKSISQARVTLNNSLIAFSLGGLLTEPFDRVNGLVYLLYRADLTKLTGLGTIDGTEHLFTGEILGQRLRTRIPLSLFTWKKGT